MGVYETNIVPVKISRLAEYVSSVKKISLDDALVYIYVNPMYEKLYDERAKWWYLSTEALYKEFEGRRNLEKIQIPKEVFEYYAYCIEMYAASQHISGMRAWTAFKESGADRFIIKNYDLLHTQGMEYAVEEIHRLVNRKK